MQPAVPKSECPAQAVTVLLACECDPSVAELLQEPLPWPDPPRRLFLAAHLQSMVQWLAHDQTR